MTVAYGVRGGGSNFGFFHWLASSPLQLSHYRASVWSVNLCFINWIADWQHPLGCSNQNFTYYRQDIHVCNCFMPVNICSDLKHAARLSCSTVGDWVCCFLELVCFKLVRRACRRCGVDGVWLALVIAFTLPVILATMTLSSNWLEVITDHLILRLCQLVPTVHGIFYSIIDLLQQWKSLTKSSAVEEMPRDALWHLKIVLSQI